MSEERAAAASGIALTIAYDGAEFSGFARQEGDIRTVQGSLEAALTTALRRPVEVTVAGRTDAGVHALGQVVSFADEGDEPASPRLARSVEALAGPGISVRGVWETDAGFSARFDAEAREYRYRIVPGDVPPLFLAPVAWWVQAQLDLDAMRGAAQALVGEHDFRSFCVAESAQGKRTFRRVDRIEIFESTELGEHCVTVLVEGNAFLHSMVRVIVGSLAEVGARRRPQDWLAEALAAEDRSAAGPTAPACGLTLWSVRYPEGALRPRA